MQQLNINIHQPKTTVEAETKAAVRGDIIQGSRSIQQQPINDLSSWIDFNIKYTSRTPLRFTNHQLVL